MPEFEKTQSQPDPENHYSPSKDASKKTGGRRRSGGFKTETAPSASGIGEIDPSEALKSEKSSVSAHSTEPSSQQNESHIEDPAVESQKDLEATDNAKKSQKKSATPKNSATPQPSEATLAAIKKVESRIAKRRQEEREKSSSSGSIERRIKSDKQKANFKTGKKTAPKGGLLATIAKFFSNLFGSASEDNQSKSSQTRVKNNKKRPASKNYNGKNQTGNSRSGRKPNSQRRNGKNRQRNGQGSAAR